MLYQGQNYAIKVVDNRAAKHLLQVISPEGKRQNRPAGNDVSESLKSALSTGFGKQGLAVSQYSANVIELSIIQLETIVAQHSLKYEASLVAEFKVTVRHNGKSYFKTFTGHDKREGVLQSDVAAMEQALNSLAATVLHNIFNDSYIQQSIKA